MEEQKTLPSVTISTENYDIINSGCIVLQMGECIDFQITDLNFKIEFIDEDPKENEGQLEGRIVSRVENRDTDNAYYKITLYNQSTAFFASTSDFYHLATIDGKPLKLKFSIQSINRRGNSSDKIFFYTWYLGKEISEQTTNNVPL